MGKYGTYRCTLEVVPVDAGELPAVLQAAVVGTRHQQNTQTLLPRKMVADVARIYLVSCLDV